MRITHVVVTTSFAGTERYVCEVARRQAERGHDVSVIGGSGDQMPADLGAAAWRPAGTVPAAVSGLLRGGRRDVVHAHLSLAELGAVLTRPVHRATVVATRHIAAHRGSSRLGRLAVPVIERGVDLEIAVSEHVAQASERAPHVVLPHGVASSDVPYDPASRRIVLLQRLSVDKDTGTALRAWGGSGLADRGWTLDVAGDGEQRPVMERLARVLDLRGVRFLGHVRDADAVLSGAALLLAPTAGEALGLSVLEAMARGVPVVASASGGHLETLPPDWRWAFPAGDVDAAAAALRDLASDDAERAAVSAQLRARQREHFDVERHVDALVALYVSNPAARRGPRA